MSDNSQTFNRIVFAELLERQRDLIHLSNGLENQLYLLGELPASEQITDCQQAASALLGRLRETLFFYDQQIIPFLESACDHEG